MYPIECELLDVLCKTKSEMTHYSRVGTQREKKSLNALRIAFSYSLKARGAHQCLIWIVCFLLVNIRASVPNCTYVLRSSIVAFLISCIASFIDSRVLLVSYQKDSSCLGISIQGLRFTVRQWHFCPEMLTVFDINYL